MMLPGCKFNQTFWPVEKTACATGAERLTRPTPLRAPATPGFQHVGPPFLESLVSLSASTARTCPSWTCLASRLGLPKQSPCAAMALSTTLCKFVVSLSFQHPGASRQEDDSCRTLSSSGLIKHTQFSHHGCTGFTKKYRIDEMLPSNCILIVLLLSLHL